MSKKKLVKDKNNKPKVVKVIRPSVLGGLGAIALSGVLVAGCICGYKNANENIKSIKSDFVNNNIEYREYIARKNAEIDYEYNNGSGDMTFEEWEKKKSKVNSMYNVYQAMTLFADDDVKEEYDDCIETRNGYTSVGTMSGVGLAVSSIITACDIGCDGFTETIIKTKKEKDEEEMVK